jgi:hypothetical protein
MTLLNRITKTIFKCTLAVDVDYHGGGFFVRANVSYLIFSDTQKVFHLQRSEGGHPFDNKYEMLLNAKDRELFKPIEISANLVEISNSLDKALCMPSIFPENVHTNSVTELLVDYKTKTSKLVYHKVYDFS